MKTSEIRSKYLEFFAQRGHRVVPSSSLVPAGDNTLLFTNAGMVQFKDALIGIQDLGFKRATSAQRCVRAGGKHNDLENVGYTARHHTFFEMMGNFSFADYFKEDTIRWAWEFITQVLNIPRDRLWVTVHPEDDQSRDLWINTIGVDANRVVPIAENFWAMGDTGPCGPCTEIFFDHGPDVPGGPPGSPDEDGDRFVEFWNLVFPQFDRSPDGTLTPLPKPGVDTGMGLERVAAITQGVHSNYEIDLFKNLIRAVGEIAGIGRNDQLPNPSVRVIADHIRSSAFLIADGVTPSNEDRGYVLRRIIRRALRHGHKLDIRGAFFHRLVEPLASEMGEAYPILREQRERIAKVLLAEEERFAETLALGMELLEKSIRGLKSKEIPGDVVFRLYDTFGFPVDLTADVARERGLTIDTDGFDIEMEKQRERARSASKFDADIGQRIRIDRAVEFLGYDTLETDAKVLGLFSLAGGDVKAVDILPAGQPGVVVLDRTPFYAESGGQVGDVGRLTTDDATFEVTDTTLSGRQHLHRGEVKRGQLRVGGTVTASVEGERRRLTALNHSATHLLHAALRQVLGTHVQQKGSLVSSEHLRFDFSHSLPMTDAEMREVESIVNRQIQLNSPVQTELLGYQEAMTKGAMALFGEKYGDRVRVLTMGDGFSVELCGGTHVHRTGDIGLLRIVGESGIAAGVRRIEALTGPAALAFTEAGERDLRAIADLLKTSRREVVDKVKALLAQHRDLQRESDQLKQRAAASRGADLASSARSVQGVSVLAAQINGDDPKALLGTLDALKNKLGSAVIVLGQVTNGKVDLIAGVTKDLTDRVKAGELIAMVAPQVGARGGGRPDMARAGGGDRPDALETALASVEAWVAQRL
jgi:alanyl-tRNA synthetase